MIIDNAVLQRIDRRSVDATGEATFTTGAPIGVDCFVGAISNSQRFSLGAEATQVDRVLYVAKEDLAAAGVIAPALGDLVTFAVDGEAAQTAAVNVAKDQVLEDLSHWELYLKKAQAGGAA